MRTLTICSYNLFEHLYPNRKIITREHLDLIKKLRTDGYEVVIEPKEVKKIHFITRKGDWDFLADPLFISTSSALLAIVLNILSNWIYDKMKSKKKNNSNTRIVIEATEGDRKFHYSHSGEKIDEKQFKRVMDFLEDKSSKHSALIRKTYDDEYVWPVFLNHTNRHIGWANVCEDERGLATATKIFDSEAFEKIQSGELKGLSITGIVNDSECSICGMDYTVCNHIGGKTYGDNKCTVSLKEIDLCELHVVKNPVNPLCKIEYVANPKTV